MTAYLLCASHISSQMVRLMLERFVNVLLISTVLLSFSFYFAFSVLLFCLSMSFGCTIKKTVIFQQIRSKAYSVGLVFTSLLGPEFEPLPHICSFIIYDVL